MLDDENVNSSSDTNESMDEANESNYQNENEPNENDDDEDEDEIDDDDDSNLTLKQRMSNSYKPNAEFKRCDTKKSQRNEKYTALLPDHKLISLKINDCQSGYVVQFSLEQLKCIIEALLKANNLRKIRHLINLIGVDIHKGNPVFSNQNLNDENTIRYLCKNDSILKCRAALLLEEGKFRIYIHF